MRFGYYELRRVFLLVLLASISPSSAALQFNVTINHTHPSISYRPSTSWTALTTNIASELQNSGCLQQQPPSTFSIAPVEAEREEVEEPRSFQITTGVTGLSKELNNRWTRSRPPAYCRRGGGECDVADVVPQGHLDSSPWPITFRFKFIGSAVYVFGFAIPSPLIDQSSTIGATLTIDGEQLQTFSADTGRALPCSMNEPIFSHVGLSNDREHELVVNISPSWKFFLNAITFTHSDVDLALRSPPPSSFTPSSRTSQKVLRPRTEGEEATSTTDDHSKKHNVATFAAAISSVVGGLAIVSLIVTFSIIRRRRRARRRDHTEEQQQQTPGPGIIPRIRARRISSSTTTVNSSSTVFHTEASEDTPNPNFDLNAVVNNGAQMMGEGPTTPFVPRFFHPGTTVLLYSADRRRDATLPHPSPGSIDIEHEDGVLPPPYDLSVGVGSPHPISPGTTSQIIPTSTTQLPIRIDALHQHHLPIGGSTDEDVRDYTYADAPPPGTPPALPSRPPSPSPPPSLSASSLPSPRSQSPSHLQSPSQLGHPARSGSGYQTSLPLPSLRSISPSPLPPMLPLLPPSPSRRTPSPAPGLSELRGAPPGLN